MQRHVSRPALCLIFQSPHSPVGFKQGPSCGTCSSALHHAQVHKQHFSMQTYGMAAFPLMLAARLFADGLCCQIPAEQRPGQT